MEIRFGKNEADFGSASYLYAMGWKAGYKGIFSEALLSGIPLDFWVSAFRSFHESQRFQLAILSAQGEDLGAGAWGLSRDYDDPALGEVTSLYLLPKCWGKGYASALMDFMLDKLKEMGCRKAHVWVLTENRRAQRFYEKCGFQML